VLTAGCAVTRIIARSSGPFFDHGVGMEWMAESRHWTKSTPSAAAVPAAIFGKSCRGRRPGAHYPNCFVASANNGICDPAALTI